MHRFVLATVLALAAAGAGAQEFPSRTVRLVVGFPVAVNPDSKLERIAHRRGWPIVIFSRRTKAVVRRTSQGVGATSLAIGSFVAGSIGPCPDT